MTDCWVVYEQGDKDALTCNRGTWGCDACDECECHGCYSHAGDPEEGRCAECLGGGRADSDDV